MSGAHVRLIAANTKTLLIWFPLTIEATFKSDTKKGEPGLQMLWGACSAIVANSEDTAVSAQLPVVDTAIL